MNFKISKLITFNLIVAAVILLKLCRYGVKHYPINQSSIILACRFPLLFDICLLLSAVTISSLLLCFAVRNFKLLVETFNSIYLIEYILFILLRSYII